MSAALVARALEIAETQIGVRETGRNRGPEVDEYIRAAGLDLEGGDYPWCEAFIQWCYRHAAKDLGVENTLPRTASVVRLWTRSPSRAKSQEPTPGAIFCLAVPGSSRGHAGFVVDVQWPAWRIITIEGNSNDDGGREGVAVVKRSRDLSTVNLGFIDLGREQTAAVA